MLNQPMQVALHKYMFELLQERYHGHQNVIARLSHYLVTDQDLREFSQMLGDVYERAYTKALNDYQVQLEAAGIKVAISYAYKGKELNK
jgi:hypothetical protein